jgi:hypothetical protein
MTTVVRWTLEDPVTNELYEFAMNPSEGGTPNIEKTLSNKSTCAPGGAAIAFQGRNQVQEQEFKGTLLEQVDIEAINYWVNKTNQVYLTDDLGRTLVVYLESVEWTRVRAALYPWKHTYTVKYMIIDWPV